MCRFRAVAAPLPRRRAGVRGRLSSRSCNSPSPVQPLDGSVRIAGNEAKAPHIEVRNRSSKAIRYFEIGWIVKDSQGKEFWAASVPASGGDLNLKPGQTGRALQDTALRFSKGQGEPVAIEGTTGFVSQVEYTDGKIWVPDRTSTENAQLLPVIAPSTRGTAAHGFVSKERSSAR